MAEGQEQEDKTEEPSERRIEKALERGEVPRSADLAGFFTLGAAGLVTALFLTHQSGGIAGGLAGLLARAGERSAADNPAGLGLQALKISAFAAGAPMLAACLGAIAAGFILHRPVISTEPLAPKLSRLSPMQGAKRIFGQENLVQFAKTCLKLALILAVLFAIWRAAGARMLSSSLAPDVGRLAGLIDSLASRVFWSVLALYAVFALFDAVYQRFAWMKRLRMSHQEVKEEHKESEGSPEIKQRVRQIQRQRARQRMMAAVPKATVIITNPTHYAVALRYEPGMAAPVCLAKGVDELALKIREIAAENRIPMVENPPLARALHATAAIDAEIPVEHYKAVAEVIGHVLRIARRRRPSGR